MRFQKEIQEKDHDNVMFENNTLYSKLENLENIFISSSIKRNDMQSNAQLSNDYSISTLQLENTELKKKLTKIEEEKIDLKQTIISYHEGNPKLR